MESTLEQLRGRANFLWCVYCEWVNREDVSGEQPEEIAGGADEWLTVIGIASSPGNEVAGPKQRVAGPSGDKNCVSVVGFSGIARKKRGLSVPAAALFDWTLQCAAAYAPARACDSWRILC